MFDALERFGVHVDFIHMTKLLVQRVEVAINVNGWYYTSYFPNPQRDSSRMSLCDLLIIFLLLNKELNNLTFLSSKLEA